MWARSRHRAHGEGYFYGESVEDPVKCTGEVPILHKLLRPLPDITPKGLILFALAVPPAKAKEVSSVTSVPLW